MNIVDVINIRQLEPTDLNFILSSSIKCLQTRQKKYFPTYSIRDLYEYLESIILSAMNHKNYSILVACDKNDSDSIIGYLIADSKANHIFLQYTKQVFRNKGVQKQVLLPLLINSEELVTCEWVTQQSLRFHNNGSLRVRHRFIEQLIKETA